jgi:tetratricopeptide (TPR) repeat protein
MIEGKALTALAEAALLREADLPKATELIDEALEALPGEGRFTALEVRARIAYWVGDFELQKRLSEEALEIARRFERKDLESAALNDLADAYKNEQRTEEAEELMRQALELSEESGSIVGKAQALHSLGSLHVHRDEAVEGERLLEESRGLFAEVGDAWMQGRVLNGLAWAAEKQGDDATAERRLRDAIRLLKPLEDRGALCESQRALAEVLIRRGRVDEAERIALEAVETVGEHDLSSQATTTMSLGLVRAAQGRDDEAEQLLRDALTMVDESGFRGLQTWILSRLAEFLGDRGRDDEAAVYRERLAELAPVEGVAAAFSSRMERIA